MTGVDDGKVVLVTGASRGIGKSIAVRLAKSGYIVAASSTNDSQDELFKLRTEIGGRGSIEFFPYDLRCNPAGLLSAVISHFGACWGLVNNAGILASKPFGEICADDIESVMSVNFIAPMLLSQALLQFVKENGTGGRIVNISSIATKFGMGRNGAIHYAGSKAALECMTTGISRLGAPYGLLANAVRPGPVETEMQIGRASLNERIDLIPLKRLGKPEEVAAMVDYLLSPSGDFITGQMISVSGGE